MRFFQPLAGFMSGKEAHQRLISSSLLVLFGKISSNTLSFLSFLLMARTYQVEEIGLYTYSASIAGVISVVANWGTNEFLFRQGAAAPQELPHLLRASKAARGLLGVILGGLAAVAFGAWHHSTFHPLVFAVIFLITLIESQTMANVLAFRARGMTGFEAWFFPLRNLLRLAVVLGLCAGHRPFAEVLLGLLAVSAAGLWTSNFWVGRLLGADRSAAPWSGALLLATLRRASPFALVAIISMGYTTVAPILLGLWHGPREVGLYGAAFQIYQVALFIPASLNVALIPKLVEMFQHDDGRWSDVTRRLCRHLLLLGLGLGVVLFFTLPPMVRLAFGEKYAAAQPIMRILLMAFVFTFVWASVLLAGLMSSNDTRVLNLILLAMLAVNLLANVVLIPALGAQGAAYANLISEGLAGAGGIAWLLTRNRAALKPPAEMT